MTIRYEGEWLTLEQAADKLGLPRAGRPLREWTSALRGLCDSEQIGYRELRPGVWRVANADVDSLLESQRWRQRRQGACDAP